MIEALHIVDSQARPDMLDQLDMLAGAEDRVLSAGPPPRGLARPVTPVHCTMGSSRLAGWRMRDQAGGAKIIHAWSPRALWAARELSLITGRAMVLSLPAAPVSRDDWTALRQAVGPGLLNVIVPTDFARGRLVAAGLPPAFCHTLAPAARIPDDADETRARIREALGIGGEAKLLVAPDPFVRHAGHEYASWAHAILRQVPVELRLAFPSSGPMEEHVRFFAHTTGFDDEVYFTRGRFTVAEVIAAGDIAVFPQTRDVGVACLSAAMAAGLAIAASGVGGTAELAPDGKAALLSGTGPRETSAALMKLAEDDRLARRLGRSARARAGKLFNLRAAGQKLQAIYAAAMESKAH